MNKLIMCKGLPASGKSTWSREMVLKQGYKRVNRDDLRLMIDNGEWSKANEKKIVEYEQLVALGYLLNGFTVIIDDTNLSPSNEAMWRAVISDRPDIEFEIMDFTHVHYKVCIERDMKRENSVGKKVILGMYEQFLKPVPVPYDPKLPNCYIFDIDGTLALKGNRSPFDWKKVGIDTVNEPVAGMFAILKNYKKFIFSGRDSICKAETTEWLKKHGLVDYAGLCMRPEGNNEKDSIIKQRMYEEHIKGKYNVIGIFDDRNQVVDMWRGLGLPVFQVNDGDF